ncbi:hypothetical protein OIU84_026482 [Salix udensis]|uniref:Secreted protein n=1 Tax=Salix udensis TaxID=889485 RepID=A0AAD6KLW3_9ROSI|nr:hypothetical protein OIU84_026482 [Salix udensis]
MMGPAREASTLILVVVAKTPKLVAGAGGGGSTQPPPRRPGTLPAARGSLWDGTKALPSSHSPCAKWHLSPNLQPSALLYFLHSRLLTADGAELLGTAGTVTVGPRFTIWATAL